MKRLLALLIAPLLVCGFIAVATPSQPVAAYDVFGNTCKSSAAKSSSACGTNGNNNPVTGTSGLLYKVTRTIALVAGSAAVIMIIVGGFMYIVSNGDAGKVSTAKNTVIYSAVGLLVILLGQAIIAFVVSKV